MAKQKPNIVYIFCDELKRDALSCYGNPYIKTKAIDEIANMGMRFENCYCNSPVCVASRYSLLTGLYPEDTGVYHNEAAYPNFHLPKQHVSFPEVFSQHGYVTASFGKTHIPETENPVFMYQDETGGDMSLGISIKEEATGILKPKGSFKTILAGVYPSDKAYYPGEVSNRSMDWIGKQTQPFLVRISYLQPHTPIVIEQKYVEKLKDIEFPTSMTRFHSSAFEQRFREICDLTTMSRTDIQKMHQYYYAMVLWIDEQVQRILQYLKDTKLIDNTIIVFNADHGALRGENMSLAKQVFIPQSHQVPLLIAYPNHMIPQVRSDICSNLDLSTTLFTLANIDIPKQFKGIDLCHAHNDEIYATIGFGEKNSYAFPNKRQGNYSETQGWPRRSCIRTNHYRLDMNIRMNGMPCKVDQEDIFFCDIQKYPNEDHNQVKDSIYQDVIKDLRQKLCEHCANSVEVDSVMLEYI